MIRASPLRARPAAVRLPAHRLFLLAGVIAFKNLSIEAFPDVTDIQVTVITLYPGYAAEEVEKQVTTPSKSDSRGLPNAVRMFSHTQFGLSFLIVTFNDKATDAGARQLVLERLRGVDLPTKPRRSSRRSPLPSASCSAISFDGPGHDLTELRSLQDWVVERQMRLAPGRRRRRHSRRLHEAIPGEPRPRQAQVVQHSRCSRCSTRWGRETPTPAAATWSRATSSI